MLERQRLYSEVVADSSKSSGSEAELPQESRRNMDTTVCELTGLMLIAYQLEEEDAALQMALSLILISVGN